MCNGQVTLAAPAPTSSGPAGRGRAPPAPGLASHTGRTPSRTSRRGPVASASPPAGLRGHKRRSANGSTGRSSQIMSTAMVTTWSCRYWAAGGPGSRVAHHDPQCAPAGRCWNRVECPDGQGAPAAWCRRSAVAHSYPQNGCNGADAMGDPTPTGLTCNTPPARPAGQMGRVPPRRHRGGLSRVSPRSASLAGRGRPDPLAASALSCRRERVGSYTSPPGPLPPGTGDIASSSTSPSPRRSSRSASQTADQAQPARLVTHAIRVQSRVSAGQPRYPRTRRSPQLRNAGQLTCPFVAARSPA